MAVPCVIVQPVIPFRVQFVSGISLHQQVVYAATKAVIAGQMRPGDPFPSVRALSKELKINPNTAHKVVTTLIAEGLLEPLPGIGTIIAKLPKSTALERTALLGGEIEHLVVEAKKLQIGRDDVLSAVSEHWDRLQQHREDPTQGRK